MPLWIRCLAFLAVIAFLVSSFGGILGADGWWQASGVVFAVASAIVFVYQSRRRHEAEEQTETESPTNKPTP